MFRLMFLSVLIWTTSKASQPAAVKQADWMQTINATCSRSRDRRVVNAFRGWPIGIACGDAPFSLQQHDLHMCLLIDIKTSAILLNASSTNLIEDSVYKIKNTSRDFNLFMVLSKNDHTCTSTHIDVVLSDPSTERCQESPGNATSFDVIQGKAGSDVKLQCRVPSWLQLSESRIDVSWTKNCTTSIAGNTTELKISTLALSDAGNYICSVKYNNQTWIVSRFQLTVTDKEEDLPPVPSIVCLSTSLLVSVGSPASVNCSVTMPHVASSSGIAVKWTKSGQETAKCQNMVGSDVETRHQDVSCSLNLLTPIRSPTSNQDSNSTSIALMFSLHFPAVRSSDIGSYQVEVDLNRRGIANVSFELMTSNVAPQRIMSEQQVPRNGNSSLRCNSDTVRAIVGGQATIECRFTGELGNTRVTWTKGISQTSICETNGGILENKKPQCNTTMTPAGNLQTQDGILLQGEIKATLFFNKVDEKDFSVYTLIVTTALGRQHRASVTLDNQMKELNLMASSCEKLPANQLTGYRGWPLPLKFTSFLNSFDDESEPEDEGDEGDYEDLYESTSIEFQLWDKTSGVLLFNRSVVEEDLRETSYNIPDLNNLSVVDYLMVAKSPTGCWSRSVHVNITELEVTSCEESVRRFDPVSRTVYEGSKTSIPCGDRYSNPFYNGKYSDLFNVTWLRNCSKVNDLATQGGNAPLGRPVNDTLEIQNFSFDHPGVYTCAVEHNGRTYYVPHQAVCVKHRQGFTGPSVQCTQQSVHAKVGSLASIQCTGNFYGNLKMDMLSARWRKVDTANASLACVNYFLGRKSRKLTDSRITCHTSVSRSPCFLHIPGKKERERGTVTVTMTINFQNVKSSDFGSYMVLLGGSSKTSSNGLSNATVHLVESQEELVRQMTRKTGALWAGIAVLVAIALTAVSIAVFRRVKAAKRPPSCVPQRSQFDHVELISQTSSSPQRSP